VNEADFVRVGQGIGHLSDHDDQRLRPDLEVYGHPFGEREAFE
jgi:hypothetical protein